MKQVIFLIDSLSRSGGLERFIQSTCELLKGHYSTHVIKFDGTKSDAYFELPETTKIHTIKKFKKNRYLARFPKGTLLTSLIKKKLESIEGELIIIPVGSRILEYALKYLSKDYKIIACEHRNSEAAATFQEAKIIRKYASEAACWMALTQFDKDHYKKLNNKVFFVPNYTPLINENTHKKIISDELKLVSLGHLTPRKGFDRALDFLKTADDKTSKTKISYHIYGDTNIKPSYFELLKNKAKKLKNIEVIFHGKSKDLKAIFNNHHAYIMSSNEEAFGLVLIEAKAYGLPCISIDAPHSTGPREIIRDRVDGFICKSQKDFKEAIQKLESSDYKDLSGNAQKDQIERFSAEPSLRNWRLMLESI